MIDDKAFIFTLKNPHGLKPTRYMMKDRYRAIVCCPGYGPTFGSSPYYGIYIANNCTQDGNCYINNNDYCVYECHPVYKESLFVNTAEPGYKNYFSVLDYEVYCIDLEDKDNINKLCKHPDIMMEYIETKDISEESLAHVDDDTELLSDLDAIHNINSNIRLKISRYLLTNPSELLVNTQIVSKEYDAKLREWLGNDYKWKLIYRASEHDYSVKSFHDYCDNKGPILVVIKSSGGWIFGGYTTQSWSGSIYIMI